MAVITNFKDRIVDYVDSIPAAISDDGESIFNAGIADVINRIRVINKEALYLFATSGSITDNTGYTLSNGDILDVSRNSKECSYMPAKLRFRAADSGSLYYASARFPVFYMLGGKIYIVPVPTGEEVGTVSVVEVGTVTNYGSSTSSIASFPSDYYHLPVLYTAKEIMMQKMISHDVPSSISLPVIPIAPVISSFSISASAPSAPSISANTVSFSTTAPSYTQPVVVLPDIPTISDVDVSDGLTQTMDDVLDEIPDLSATNTVSFSQGLPVYVAPTAVSQTAFSDYSSGLTQSAPGALSVSAVVPVAPESPSIDNTSISSVTISSFGTAPAYTIPVIESPDWTDMDSWITAEDSEMAGARIASVQSKIQQYQSDIQNAVQEFNDTNVEYQAEIQQNIEQAKIDAQKAQQDSQLDLQAQIQDYQSKLENYRNNVQSYQAEVNKEIQEYQANLGGYSAELPITYQAWAKTEADKINIYTAEVQNNLSAFNSELNEYQAQLQVSIKNLDADNEYDRNLLSKYNARLEGYKAEVTELIQEFVNNMQKDVNLYQSESSSLLQQYSADIQNELNKFNEENAEYQAQLKIALQNASQADAKQIRDVQKYSGEVQQYAAEVNAEVQEYTSKLQLDLKEYDAEISSYSAKSQALIQEFNSNLQSKQAEYTWMLKQYEYLAREYAEAFVPFQKDIKNG